MIPVLITVLGEIGDIHMMCSVRFGDILLMSSERWVTYSLGPLGVHDIHLAYSVRLSLCSVRRGRCVVGWLGFPKYGLHRISKYFNFTRFSS
jgi:hypothetical protein